jgi:DNA-binding beta-propeller fold protein YncE
MSRKLTLLMLVCLPAWAQNAAPPSSAQVPTKGRAIVNTPELQIQADRLKALVGAAPKLALERTQIKIQSPGAGWELAYPSAVTMDDKGLFYILQRGDKADPVLVVNKDGKIVRSWGKGMYEIPHSIRIDPQGNVWTADSGSSMIYKFTPEGKKLMEISVGEQPAGRTTGSRGTSDIAFGPNGRIFISDGYGNARVLEYNAKGERVNQWGSAGNGPGQFRQPHGIAVDDENIVYVADRQNARLQRFDLSGKYLGEWSDLGRVTAVAFRDGNLWIGTQFNNESNESDGWHMKIDRKTGKILGYVISGHSHHVLNVTKRGELLAGARPDIPWYFHPTK